MSRRRRLSILALVSALGMLAGGFDMAGAQPPARAVSVAAPSDLPQAELDAFMEDIMRIGAIPGAAVAIVREGHVVALRAYGVRELGRPERVDADTIFDAASLTKSFTATAIAALADEGKMSWDDPVRRHLPEMQFPDPYLTNAITIRDLLSHRTGIAPTDSAWYFTGMTRPQLVALAGRMQITAPFRTRSLYSNIGYTIAGEAAAAAAGQSWEALITGRLLRPLGMTRSTADFDAAPAMGNLAAPHAVIRGVQRPIPRETTRMSTAPAAGVQASVRDLATWMLFQLGDGTWHGPRIVSASQLAEMRAPQIVIPTTEAFRDSRQMRFFAGYGLGWQVFDYGGTPMVWHSGAGDGQRAYIAMLPDRRIGVAVLFNTKAVVPQAMSYIAERVFDHYLGQPPRDYLGLLNGIMRSRRQQWAEAARAARPAALVPEVPLSAFAGTYRDRLGLETRITVEDGRLRLTYGGGEPATLDYRGHNVFAVHWSNPWHDENLAMPVSFSFDENGRAVHLHMRPFDDRVDADRIDGEAQTQ